MAAVLKRVQSYRLELLRRDEFGYLSAGKRLLSYHPQLAVLCEGYFFKAAALRERIAFYFFNALGIPELQNQLLFTTRIPSGSISFSGVGYFLLKRE